MPARARRSTAWRAELRQALALAADHLSLYQLTIEPGTKFEAMHRRGEIALPDQDTAAALYEATAEEASRFGLLAYEVSNYAVPGSESRHNLTYWRYGDYAGIGPGAHGRITLSPLQVLVLLLRHSRASGNPAPQGPPVSPWIPPCAGMTSSPRAGIARPSRGPNGWSAMVTVPSRKRRCSQRIARAKCC